VISRRSPLNELGLKNECFLALLSMYFNLPPIWAKVPDELRGIVGPF